MIEILPLSQWLHRQPERVVALRSESPISTAALVERVAAWMARLQPRQGLRFAVYHRDSSEFLAILLALWQLRRIACIASDNGPGSVAQLREKVDVFVGDFPAASDRVSDPAGESPQQPQWQALDSAATALEIYTSGSSGAPKSIAKTFDQLEAELAALETLWPGDESSLVLSTVTHQHFYGLMIALLWPFCCGRSFQSLLCEYPEDIIQRASGQARFTLVSSPSHLGRLNPGLGWSELAGHCDRVLSSAAPLRRDDSLAACALLGTPVNEIYGSTETGAIAWRCQQEAEPEALWQALPGASLEPAPEGLLVRASWLDVAELVLPDSVEFVGQQGFRLQGRLDRIVKVEGKRISLVTIEQLLGGHDWVDDVRALTLERSRIEVAVAMRLSKRGQVELQQSGRKALIKRFRTLLEDHFEAVLLPRRWRFVDDLPYNSQGKLPLQALEALFERQPQDWPEILDRRLAEGQLLLKCRIPSGLAYFDGHMEGRPILPGIVQVHWAEAFARRWLPLTGKFYCLEKVKFQKVILPHYEVRVSLDFDKASGKLNFCYESERGVHSRGRICFSR